MTPNREPEVDFKRERESSKIDYGGQCTFFASPVPNAKRCQKVFLRDHPLLESHQLRPVEIAKPWDSRVDPLFSLKKVSPLATHSSALIPLQNTTLKITGPTSPPCRKIVHWNTFTLSMGPPRAYPTPGRKSCPDHPTPIRSTTQVPDEHHHQRNPQTESTDRDHLRLDQVRCRPCRRNRPQDALPLARCRP
jgi:hypothetical protein